VSGATSAGGSALLPRRGPASSSRYGGARPSRYDREPPCSRRRRDRAFSART